MQQRPIDEPALVTMIMLVTLVLALEAYVRFREQFVIKIRKEHPPLNPIFIPNPKYLEQ